MESSVRNALLGKAVRKLGLSTVAARLGITETQLRQYAINGVDVPDSIWVSVVDNKTGLISEIISQPVTPLPPD